MIGILVVSHGPLAAGLVNALEMILGKQESLDFLGLKVGEDTDSYSHRLQKKLKKMNQGSGVLIFADLMGATPFNVSARQIYNQPTYDIITGANLPLLLETLIARQGCSSVAELVEVVRGIEDRGVRIFSEIFASDG